MAQLWDKNILARAIGIIGKSGKILEAQIQSVFIQCVAQSIVHRNSTPANELYQALPKGQRHDSLVAAFEKFGNLAFSKTEKKIIFFDVEQVTDKVIEWTDAYADEVAAFHWTNGTKKPEPRSVYDVEEEVGKLLSRLTKLASDSTKEVKHADLLKRISETYNAYARETYDAEADAARYKTTAPLTEDDKAELLQQAEDILAAQTILDAIAIGDKVEVLEV